MSAYLILELVVALSDQGQMTDAPVPMTNANPVYPDWDHAPGFLAALSLSLLVYPVAAVFYAIAVLMGYAGRPRPEPPPRTLPEPVAAVPVAAVPEARFAEAGPPLADAGGAAPFAAGAEPEIDGSIVEDVCILDADLRIRYVSAPIAQLFGRTRTEMIGLALPSFIAPYDVSKLAALLLAAHSDRTRAAGSTIGIRLPDETIVAIDLSCRAASEASGDSPGTIVLTMRPLSERGRLDDQLTAIWY
jgi:PAS domain-containing protein